MKGRLKAAPRYYLLAFTGSGAAVVHADGLKLASLASRRNDVLV
jgi:hypothetical protein